MKKIDEIVFLKKINRFFSIHQKINFKIIIVLILLSSLLIRFYWGSNKVGLHMDEVLSVMYANNKNTQIDFNYSNEYSGKEIKKNIFINNSKIGNAFDDIKKIYIDTHDKPHTNFYYSILRLSFLYGKVNSLNDIIFSGIAINIVLFIIEFIYLYKLSVLFFKKRPELIYIFLFCASVASFSVSASMFLRPYQLQATIFTIFSYFFVNKFINFSKYSWKDLFASGLMVSLVLWTGYFSIIFIFLLFLFSGLYYLFNKNYDKLKYIFFSLIFGLFFVQLLYAKYWNIIFLGDDRAGEAYKKITLDYFFSNISNVIKIYWGIIFENAIYPSIFILVCFIFLVNLKNKKLKVFLLDEKLFQLLSLIISSILFSVIVLWIAPIKILRYIIPVLPFLLLLIPIAVLLIKDKLLKWLAICVLIFVYSANAFNINKIEYLYKNKYDEIEILNKNMNEPMYILSGINYKMLLEWAPYANNKNKFLFFKNSKECLNKIYYDRGDNFYVSVDTSYDRILRDNMLESLKENYIIINEKMTKTGDETGFNVYEFKKR